MSGSCSCGTIRFSSSTSPIRSTVCHCITCQKLSGNPFMTFGLYHNAAITWHGLDSADASAGIRLNASELCCRGFCQRCNSPLFMRYHCRPDATSIPLGLIDQVQDGHSVAPPVEHIFLEDRQTWLHIPLQAGVEMHQSFNPPFQKRIEEWIRRGSLLRRDLGTVDVDGSKSVLGGRQQYMAKLGQPASSSSWHAEPRI